MLAQQRDPEATRRFQPLKIIFKSPLISALELISLSCRIVRFMFQLFNVYVPLSTFPWIR